MIKGYDCVVRLSRTLSDRHLATWSAVTKKDIRNITLMVTKRSLGWYGLTLFCFVYNVSAHQDAETRRIYASNRYRFNSV